MSFYRSGPITPWYTQVSGFSEIVRNKGPTVDLYTSLAPPLKTGYVLLVILTVK